jgi:hypothetical protein
VRRHASTTNAGRLENALECFRARLPPRPHQVPWPADDAYAALETALAEAEAELPAAEAHNMETTMAALRAVQAAGRVAGRVVVALGNCCYASAERDRRLESYGCSESAAASFPIMAVRTRGGKGTALVCVVPPARCGPAPTQRGGP